MTKPFLGIEQQGELFRQRGLELESEESVERLLRNVNYYRVSGYARQFQVDPRRGGDHTFIPGSSLLRIEELMARDAELRRLLFEGLSEVEVALRSRFAHESGRSHGVHAFYLERDSYLSITPRLDDHLDKLRSELRRPNLMIARYRVGDDLSAVPVWVAIEVVSFGMLARMIQYFDSPEAAKATAGSLSLPWLGFQSTVHAFAVLRNACAHHAQLWHRPLSIVAAPAKKDRRHEAAYDANGGSVYATIIALKRYLRALGSTSTASARIDALFASDEEFSRGIRFPAPR